MKHRDKREWFLFIALLIALFLVFALWSSKERIEIPTTHSKKGQEHDRDGRLSNTNTPHQTLNAQVKEYEREDFGENNYKAEDTPDDAELFQESWNNPIWPIGNFVATNRPRIIDVTDVVDAKPKDTGFSMNGAPRGGKNEIDRDLSAGLKGIGRREEFCRRILEDVYKVPFPKVRPDFLKNPHLRSTRDGKKARNLELDGYNEELSVAFECNGKYHYKPSVFTKSLEDHKYQIWKDAYKKKVCTERGITLIQIPYTVKERDIRACIEEQLPHYREVIERLRDRGWDVPDRPLQTPTNDGLVEPSIHMGDTCSFVDEEQSCDIIYSSSYLDGLGE